MEKTSWEYCRGNWTQIDDPLFLYLRDHREEFVGHDEPGIKAIGFIKPALLIAREGITVELFARVGHKKQPYLVRTTITGKTDIVYAADFQSMLGLSGLIMSAFRTGA